MASSLNVVVKLAVIRPSVEISPAHVAIMGFYYSFKIFPQFWLAKITRVIPITIWKNFVFNEEMTSKMQPATG